MRKHKIENIDTQASGGEEEAEEKLPI
jgi:hypothetical protein